MLRPLILHKNVNKSIMVATQIYLYCKRNCCCRPQCKTTIHLIFYYSQLYCLNLCKKINCIGSTNLFPFSFQKGWLDMRNTIHAVITQHTIKLKITNKLTNSFLSKSLSLVFARLSSFTLKMVTSACKDQDYLC